MILGHVHVAVVVQVIGDERHLRGDVCDEHVGLVVFYTCEGASQSSVDEIQLVTGECLNCLLVGIFDCSTVRLLITAPV